MLGSSIDIFMCTNYTINLMTIICVQTNIKTYSYGFLMGNYDSFSEHHESVVIWVLVSKKINTQIIFDGNFRWGYQQK